MLNKKLTLNNGVQIPQLGLGTWFIDDDKAAEAVKAAVALGYRHIDTAQAYGNERGVGEGVRTCGIPREELFVVSKVAAEHKTYEEAMAGIDETLAKMGLDYLDMMIIHSPQPWVKVNQCEDRYVDGNRAAWKALEDAYKEGKLKAIGVSNFQISDINSLLETAEIKPMVNQILLHISNTPLELVEYLLRTIEYALYTVKWLDLYFSGKDPGFTPEFKINHLTEFRKEVMECMLAIPYGETTTYGQIAETIAKKHGIAKMASRAVGGAVGWNPICIIVPCHRVVGTNSSLTGYGGGIKNKVALLTLENNDMSKFVIPKKGTAL